jgi:hypothetical protein
MTWSLSALVRPLFLYRHRLKRCMQAQLWLFRNMRWGTVELRMRADFDAALRAGMAGLSCAARLHKAGVDVAIFEASDGVGGRVRTDELDGFLLDRGFQIFLTSYGEAQQALDYEALDLRPFYAGACCWKLSHLGQPGHRCMHVPQPCLAPKAYTQESLLCIKVSPQRLLRMLVAACCLLKRLHAG